jgi:hypothetical protein
MEVARAGAGKLNITIRKNGQAKTYTIKEGNTRKIIL